METGDTSGSLTRTFDLSQLRSEQQQSGKEWHEFFNTSSLSMGIYRVPAGSTNRATHEPHADDEVYFALEGNGVLTADSADHEMQPGAIVFVKAGVEHFFHDVQKDLTMLVFFAKLRGAD